MITMSSFEGVNLPFGVEDMLKAAEGFLEIYAVWIVLALAIIFGPVLYFIIVKALSQK